MKKRTLLLLVSVIIIIIFAVSGFAMAQTVNSASLKQAYDKYIASYNRYLEAVKQDLDEKALKELADKYLTDMKNYKKLLTPDELEISGQKDSAEAELEKLYAAEKNRVVGASNGALTGEAKKNYAISKVNELKQSLGVLASAYEKKIAESKKKYNETSWFSPVSKISAAYSLVRDKFAGNKVKSTLKYYATPRKDDSYTSFFKELAVEFGHVTSISALLYDTKMDDQSFIFKDAEAEKDVLIVYTMPSPHGINWASPKALALASGINQATTFHTSAKHPIGHVFMSLKTSASSDVITAGMTTFDNTEEVELVMKHGYCLGVLFADLRGKFDNPEALNAQVEERYGTGRVSYMKFLLSPSMGKRLLQYFNEYKEKGCDKHYGGANRPRFAEGGGCSPFGVSFMEVAGFLRPEHLKAWKISLAVPKKLCGGPAFGKKVSFKNLILGGGAWAKTGEESAPIEMLDPTLMYRWMLNEWKSEFNNPTGKYILEKNRKTMSLVLDCRDIEASSEPIWLEGATAYRQHGLRFGPDPYKFKVGE